MTRTERTLIAELLEMASDQFCVHVCNDLQIENTQATVDLLNAMEAWAAGAGKPDTVYTFDPTKKTITITDWHLMEYLAWVARGDD